MNGFDPGSFKDPAGRVFYENDAVYRTLSEEARLHFRAARDAGLIEQLIDDDLLVDTALVERDHVRARGRGGASAVLKQPKVPLVTYAYEWSFEMLRDAALVTLQIMERALAAGFILKDANSFNILFDGNTPKLVDAPSIESYREGTIWAGYAQFCRSFLFPLLVSAYRGVDVQALLRGTLGELPVQQAARLLRPTDYVRPGVISDVLLQARLDRRFGRAESAVKASATGHRYPKTALVANVRRLLKVITGLRAPSAPTEWSGYDTFHSYSEADRAAKLAFVRDALTVRRPRRVIDLGCNTGEYSQIASRQGAYVVAVDLDAAAVDRLYRALPPRTPVSPLVANLLNPTPAMGWGLAERPSLFDRVGGDMFLALALIHHLRITGGVPLDHILPQLFAIAPEGIVEWVDKEDTMVRGMLSLRPDVYTDYTWPQFESLVRRHGHIVSVQPTHDGRRRLCHVRACPENRGHHVA